MNTTSIAEIKGLQNKLRYITVDMEDRAVCDDQQYNELVRKFTDLIEFTDYKVDIADCLSALHDAMTNFEMYDQENYETRPKHRTVRVLTIHYRQF